MAISKIKLGNGDAQLINDSTALHYIGHATAGIAESEGVYTSSTTITIGSDPGVSTTVTKYDFVTFGMDNINLVCIDTDGASGSECTWDKLTEKAAEVPVKVVKVNGTQLVPDENDAVDIPAATTSAFGVVETGSNITNTNGVISVADAAVGTKGVVALSTSIPTTGATDTTVPTTLAVATAIAELPQAMIFRGTVGTDGTYTWDNLPEASAQTLGDVYKVLTKHTTAPICEEGDLIICALTATSPSNTYEWVVIPSGDVPAGTVTSVGADVTSTSHLTVSTGIGTEGTDPITSSGTITVGVESGYEIPTTTKTGQWDAAYTKVTPYTENTDIVNGLATAATQESGDGSVLVARVGGTANDTLFIDYIKPTIDTTKKAVAKLNS